MKYLLTDKNEYDFGPQAPEEDVGLFESEDAIARHIINTVWLYKDAFDSPYFKDKVIRPEDCWKRNPEVVRKAKARELIQTMEDLKNLKNYDMIMWELTYDWYEVEDNYTCTGRRFMDSSLYEALYDPTTGYSYMSTIGHVPGYRD